MAERPLSPHLSIWKWGPHMLVSILHRISGQGLSFVGLPVLLWWLGALASGPESYETFATAATSIPGYVILIGLSWAFFTHLCSGVRHLVLDIGANYEIDRNRIGALASLIIAILLTAAFWAAVVLL